MKRNEALILLVLFAFSLACLFSDSGGSALVLKDESLPAHVYSNVLAGLLAVVCLLRFGALFIARELKDGKRIHREVRWY